MRDRDVVVLTIHRGSTTIPNPKGSREILDGDVLLCFGKTLTLKSLAPARERKRKPKPCGPDIVVRTAGATQIKLSCRIAIVSVVDYSGAMVAQLVVVVAIQDLPVLAVDVAA